MAKGHTQTLSRFRFSRHLFDNCCVTLGQHSGAHRGRRGGRDTRRATWPQLSGNLVLCHHRPLQRRRHRGQPLAPAVRAKLLSSGSPTSLGGNGRGMCASTQYRKENAMIAAPTRLLPSAEPLRMPPRPRMAHAGPIQAHRDVQSTGQKAGVASGCAPGRAPRMPAKTLVCSA